MCAFVPYLMMLAPTQGPGVDGSSSAGLGRRSRTPYIFNSTPCSSS